MSLIHQTIDERVHRISAQFMREENRVPWLRIIQEVLVVEHPENYRPNATHYGVRTHVDLSTITPHHTSVACVACYYLREYETFRIMQLACGLTEVYVEDSDVPTDGERYFTRQLEELDAALPNLEQASALVNLGFAIAGLAAKSSMSFRQTRRLEVAQEVMFNRSYSVEDRLSTIRSRNKLPSHKK